MHCHASSGYLNVPRWQVALPSPHTLREHHHQLLPCRYMVSQHPEVEAKILAELEGLELSITPQRPRPRKMTYADVNQLTYLQATIKVPSLSWSLPNAAILTSLILTSLLSSAALPWTSEE